MTPLGQTPGSASFGTASAGAAGAAICGALQPALGRAVAVNAVCLATAIRRSKSSVAGAHTA